MLKWQTLSMCQVSFIQTDASFDSGVVGGPLVNEFGEVVGINSVGMTPSKSVQFSVPINQIRDVITDLADGKVGGQTRVVRGSLLHGF